MVAAETEDTRIDVSVLMVGWNTRELLQGCLTSIYEHTRDIDYEII